MKDGPRRLVARHRRRARAPTARPGAARQRAHALPALHSGTTGQAQGHPAHDRPATCSARQLHPRDGLRHQARRRLLVRRRHRLGDRPLLHRLRPARQRARPASCTRARPTRPTWDRWWQIIEEYRVTILYSAPTAIRAFMKQGDAVARAARPVVAAPARHASASRSTPRRGSGTTSTSAAARCPIVDTWWQTETGMIMITPLPGRHRRPSPAARRSRSRASTPTSSTTRATPCRSAAAATSSSSGRGRRCCAASTATPSATRRRTGAASRACTSPATAPSATRRATSGCSAASTT